MECRFTTGGKCQLLAKAKGLDCAGDDEAKANCPMWVEEPGGDENCKFASGSQCFFATGKIGCGGKTEGCPVWQKRGRPRLRLIPL